MACSVWEVELRERASGIMGDTETRERSWRCNRNGDRRMAWGLKDMDRTCLSPKKRQTGLLGSPAPAPVTAATCTQ